MTKHILTILLLFLAALNVSADPHWKMHNTFDGEIDYIFETPEYVYYTSRTIPDMDGQRRMSLFRYDKEGEEMQTLSTDNVLTANTVSMVQYNPKKGYVVAVGTNYDITFIYDDGRVVAMPDYRLANISKDKTVNSITIDPWHDRIYLATNFGYLAINDEKYEIAESRDYGESIKSVGRIGNHIVILKSINLYIAKASNPRLSLSEYEERVFDTPFGCVPISERKCLIFNYGGERHRIVVVEEDGNELISHNLLTGSFLTYSNSKNGLLVTSNDKIFHIDDTETVTVYPCPKSDYGLVAATYDLSEIWQGKQRKGIKSSKPGDTAAEWLITRDFMSPDAPSPFFTSNMTMHPDKGVLVLSYPQDYTFFNYPQTVPLLISGYKDGWWTNYAPVYTNEDRSEIMKMSNGLAVDPDDSDYIYVTSMYNGFLRLNLDNPSDILHLSKPSDVDNGNEGFIEFVPDPSGWSSCNFSTPRFDKNGNLWTVHSYYDDAKPLIHLYCWEASDRKSSLLASTANMKLPKEIQLEYHYESTYLETLLPLNVTGKGNRLLFSSRNSKGELAIIDTNGTPIDGSDDTITGISSFVDQDGTTISVVRIRQLWEDPSTGNVWVTHSNGVFYFNPDDFLDGKNGNVYRIKVARNDGTNLADYLLEGVAVNHMTTDGRGRKWFATIGGGIVITSSDGRTVEQEINTDNSPIPSDNVYGMMYLPTTNSMLIATSEGIAEYYLSADASGDGDSDLKIYPNPVRPDYFGYVTIEGLPDRSLVKIVDASGNIVKEMGPVSGDVQWDVTNHQYKRVSSGVYFVLASAGENESAFSTVGKILVVN